jgi:hypothetical protein
MNEKDLYKLLQEKLDSSVEMPDASVWDGIRSKMARRHRMIVVRRVSFISVAAAAVFAAGLFIFRGDEISTLPSAPSIMAESILPETETPADQDVMPMAEQIAGLTSSGVTAQQAKPVSSPVTHTLDKLTESPLTTADKVVEEKVVADMVVSDDDVAEEQVVVQEDKPATDPVIQEWDEKDLEGILGTEKPTRHNFKKNTSLLAISSNISQVASKDGLIADLGPKYAPSELGTAFESRSIIPFDDEPQFDIPLSFSLQFKQAIVPRLYVGTGLVYTYLHTQYSAMIDLERHPNVSSQLHYLGIPLHLSYNFVDRPRFDAFVSAGGMVDKCIMRRYVYGSTDRREKVDGVQWSVNLGLGVEYWFVQHVGIAFKPSVAYYFDNDQPLSIRTNQPIQFNLELGLRFRM